MKALVVPASELLRMAYVELDDDSTNRLRQLQQLVGGNIEAISTSSRWTLWGWEDARIFDAPHNGAVSSFLRRTYGYPMLGDFVLMGCTASGDDCEPPAIISVALAQLRNETLPDNVFPFDVVLGSLGVQREIDRKVGGG